MKLRIYRKRNGRSYKYTDYCPKGWIIADSEDLSKEYATVEEANAALNPPVKKKAATKKKAVVKETTKE